ncbi:DUF4231 domain-containing protein [Metamycoplasma neophronis]|uniref:DUF4231 domain-containing protein n=1 Tax=Metamycoplasma neophronis TaxID=872983 RepID=A0ABY2YZV9_9BACT|nr:DUF4231 domain-containing protein [Metamycoplasma neophronis]TPR53378.1 DUF4231 domain-containing protein [Metamycoplasma neophronis]
MTNKNQTKKLSNKNPVNLDSYLLHFVKKYLKSLKTKIYLWGFAYVTLNLLILVVTVVLSVLGSIQLYYNFKAFGENSWQTYLLITTAITAATTFSTSIMSFFAMRKKIVKYQARVEKINVEMFLYTEKLGKYRVKKNRDLNLYISVCQISDLNYGGISYGEKETSRS